MAQQKWHNVAQQMAQRTQFQHYASQPKNPTATRKPRGYRVMNKTDTHSDIIFYIYLNITLSDKNMLFNANTANNSKINLLKVEL